MPETELSKKKREFTRRDFFLAGALTVGTLSAVGTYFTPGGSTQSSVRIQYATGADSSGARDLLVDMWNEANPRSRVDIVEVGGESTFDQRNSMVNLVNEGKVDVLNLDVIHVPFFRENDLIAQLELDDVLDFVPNTLLASQFVPPDASSTTPSRGTPSPSPSTAQPEQWAAPYTTDVGMIFQRVTPDTPPGDVPTLAELIDRIVPDNSRQLVQQLLPGGNRSHEALVVNVLEHALSRDQLLLDKTTGMPALDLERWRSALRPLRDALADGKIEKTDTEDMSAAVYRQRRLPYMRNWPVRYRDLQITGDTDSLSGRVRLGPLPTGVLGGGSLVVAANAPQASRAQEFIRFLTDVPAQKVLAQLGVPPTRSPAYVERFKTTVPHVITVRDAVDVARPRPVSVYYQDFSEVAYGHFANLVGGADLPSTFIDDIREALRI